MTAQVKKIILFDGVCNLCNSTVQFVIREDKEDVFRFAPLQSELGQRLIRERAINTKEIDSIILIEPDIAYYTKSDAALQIGKSLKRYRTLSRFLMLFPEGLRNFAYDFVARNRYKWYGKKDACMIPSPELKAKFLE